MIFWKENKEAILMACLGLFFLAFGFFMYSTACYDNVYTGVCEPVGATASPILWLFTMVAIVFFIFAWWSIKETKGDDTG